MRSRAAVTDRTRVVFVNNASFPSGLGRERRGVGGDRRALCRAATSGSLYWGGFEGVLFDGLRPCHPAALPGMRERTVTVGAASSSSA